MKPLHGLLLAVLGLTLAPAVYSAKRPPSPAPSLAAPSNLSATLVATTQVRLTWQDNSSDERQFNIERSTNGFIEVVTFVTRANVAEYTDTGLQPRTTYVYRVRASTRNASSEYSNLATVTIPEPLPPPAAPSGLRAATLDTSRIHLTWVDNSGDELQFKMERSTDDFASAIEVLLPADTTEYTDAGLQSGIAYAYRVRACNMGGCSDASDVASANTGLVIGPWRAIFLGVEYATGLTAVATSPRQVVNALRIDLQAPGIRLFSSPRRVPWEPPSKETAGMTTSHFLVQHNLQAVINGNWFSPCCTAIDGADIALLGLAVSDNVVVSEQESEYYSSVMAINAQNDAAMIPMNWPPADNASINTAVAGKNAVLVNGVYVGTNVAVAPRTALGISEERRYLILITIDGRQPGYSDGAADADTAAWMARFGAHDAFNLDGGGSTTMAVADGQGGSLVLNRPSDGLERAVGNHLGVYAQPLSASAAVLLGQTPPPKLAPEEELLLQILADSMVDPTPQLTVTPLDAGQQRIRVKGLPDYTYQIQTTESLVNPDWQPLANGRANEVGEFDVIDALRGAPRYYRARHR